MRKPVLGDLNRAQCRKLAEETQALEFPGVLGPDQTAGQFVERAVELGLRFLEPMPQRIHALSGPPRYPRATGEARAVTVEDADLFADWMLAFHHEVSLHDPVPSREFMERRAASGDHLFWVVGGVPVSMAGIARRTRRAGAIGAVYTPPEQRGRGFAGSVTAAVVERIYAEGRTTACLYTDLRNPFSNRCYAKVGFRPVCESRFFPRQSDPAER